MDKTGVYLDHNATTPLHPRVKKAIINSLELWANPSSASVIGQQAKEAIDTARERIAQLLRCQSSDVIFTSGGTETNNWVLWNAIEQNVSKVPGKVPHIVTSNIEHPAIEVPLQRFEAEKKCEVTRVLVNAETGQVNVRDVLAAIKDNTCLVTVMWANNETGVIQPIVDMCAAIKSTHAHIRVHSDAAQAIGKVPVQLGQLDYLTVVGHKFYGPRIGALVANGVAEQKTALLKPMFLGGGQEGSYRSGTENTPMIVGLGEAALVADEMLKSNENVMLDRRERLLGSLRTDEVMESPGYETSGTKGRT